ncbi:hypothetical protein Cgig2_010147 [Carnegiea gigantea]|uniref:Aminotransferase-like plant mobile domain-containing protein n=1 Tax=Carnegiea gigantea TaxID=171969 RepID=A0A9Q1KIB3_9CARY|nr:hypothetical protein Cgig2_010147 [Carnegiea gigantea]
MQGCKGKPTIEQWIAFWFRGRNKYHIARKLDQDNRIPHPRILSSIIHVGARGWGDCQVIFDELGVAIGQRTETFLAAFLSCWLCIFILPVRDAGCIRPGTFSVASFMASGVGYGLPTAILTNIYKGLNKTSRSSHPGRGEGYFPAHFFYTWLAKNFDVYELVGEASSSPGMMKFSNIGQAKSHLRAMEQGLKSYFLGDAIYSREIPLVHFVNGGPRCSFSRLEDASDSKRKRSDLFDMNTSKDEGKLGSKPKLKIVHSGKPLEPFVPPMGDGSSRVKIPRIDVVIPATPITVIPIQSITPLPQVPIGICEPTTEKVTELPPEGVKNIMDILNSESNPTECMEELAHIPLPSGSQCFLSIGRIPSFGNDLFDGKSRLVDSRGVCSLDDDEVESICRINAPSLVTRPQRLLRAPQGGIFVFNAEAVIKKVDKNAARVFGKAILDKVCHTPFDGLLSLKDDFDSLYATTLQRGVDFIPLESKVEVLIKQACKLDEAFCRLNTEGTHYEAKTAELKHVESRSQELLKELQLLEEQQKYLSSQVAASEHLL